MTTRLRTKAFCHPTKFVKGLGMCQGCYNKFKQAKIPYCKVPHYKFALCHPQKLNKANGLCGACYDKELKYRNQAYKKKQIANTKEWHKKHPEKLREYNAKDRMKPDFKSRKHRAQKQYKLKQYGLTFEEYLQLSQMQNDQCAICYKNIDEKAKHLDHDHLTNQARGLLCHTCNMALGLFKDRVDWLENAQKYLSDPPVHKLRKMRCFK